MNPQIKVVLTEMFKKVGLEFSEDLVKEDGWYWKCTWTNKAEDEFRQWFVDYLYNNVAARKAIMSYPKKNKVYIRRVVEEFIWQYGWKVNG